MELQKITTESQLANTHQQVEFTKQLFHVNCLVSYPINDVMLEVWTKSINELAPEMTSDDLKFIIDKMKIGVYPYDHRVGIQNIFKGYKKLIESKVLTLSIRTQVLYHKDCRVELDIEEKKEYEWKTLEEKRLNGLIKHLNIPTVMQY